VTSLAEGKRVNLDAGIEEDDLEGSLGDGATLADKVVKLWLSGSAVAEAVHMSSVRSPRRPSVEVHAKSHGRTWRCRSHNQVQVAGVEAVGDSPLGLVKDRGLHPHRPLA